jgi:hypothetical protein
MGDGCHQRCFPGEVGHRWVLQLSVGFWRKEWEITAMDGHWEQYMKGFSVTCGLCDNLPLSTAASIFIKLCAAVAGPEWARWLSKENEAS